jgi:hypothetical protein
MVEIATASRATSSCRRPYELASGHAQDALAGELERGVFESIRLESGA